MIIYLLRRFLLAVITLFILTLFSFSIVYYKELSSISDFHLGNGYINYLADIIHGRLGYSELAQKPITELFRTVLPVTIELSVCAMIIAFIVGSITGIISAIYYQRLPDKIINVFVLVGLSSPVFWLGLVLLMFFSFYLDWLPVFGRYDAPYPFPTVTGFIFFDSLFQPIEHREEIIINLFKHAILPVTTLALGPITEITRLFREIVLKISSENYIKAAAARGLSPVRIIFRHVLSNAFPPIIPKLSLQISTLFTLTMIVENVFDWRGIGFWVMYALRHQDYAVISAAILVIGLLIILSFMALEIISLIVNPLKRQELYVFK